MAEIHPAGMRTIYFSEGEGGDGSNCAAWRDLRNDRCMQKGIGPD